jgi:hypothetical protein
MDSICYNNFIYNYNYLCYLHLHYYICFIYIYYNNCMKIVDLLLLLLFDIYILLI